MKTNIVRSVKVSTASMALAALFMSTASAAPSGFYMTANSSTVNVGASVQVTVRLNSAAEVDTTHVVLTYPANTLSLSNVGSGIEPFELATSSDTSTAGTVTFDRFSMTGAPAGATGDTAIATLTFTATASGSAQIKFAAATEADRGGAKVNQALTASTITVTTPAPAPKPTPQPTTNPSPTTNSPAPAGAPTPSSSSSNSSTASKSQPLAPSKQVPKASASSTPNTNASVTTANQSHVTLDSDGPVSTDPSIPSHQVTLTLHDKNNKPLKSAQIIIDSSTTATTDDKGQVTIEGMHPGMYEIAVKYKGKAYVSQFNVNDIGTTDTQSQKLLINVKNSSKLQPKTGAVGTTIALAAFAAVIAWRFIYIRPRGGAIQSAPMLATHIPGAPAEQHQTADKIGPADTITPTTVPIQAPEPVPAAQVTVQAPSPADINSIPQTKPVQPGTIIHPGSGASAAGSTSSDQGETVSGIRNTQ